MLRFTNSIDQTRHRWLSSRGVAQAFFGLLATLVALPASAQVLPLPPIGGMPHPGDPYSADPRSGYHSREIRQSVRGTTVMALRQLLSLGREYDGDEVESVILTASSQSGRGTARVLVNRYAAAPTEVIDVMTRDLVFRLDPRNSRLGIDVNTLELEIAGNIFVTRVAVQLRSRPAAPGRDSVRRVIQHRVIGRDILDVRSLLSLYDRADRGREVREVVLTARPEAGQGLVQLMIDGRLEGVRQVVDPRSGEIVLLLSRRGNRLDIDLNRLEVLVQGRVLVTSIGVRFERGYGGGRPPRPMPPGPPGRRP